MRIKFIYFLIPITLILTACSTKAKSPSDINRKDIIPKLNRPEVRRVWVPDQISGDEYISGHWKYLINKNAVWSKED